MPHQHHCLFLLTFLGDYFYYCLSHFLYITTRSQHRITYQHPFDTLIHTSKLVDIFHQAMELFSWNGMERLHSHMGEVLLHHLRQSLLRRSQMLSLLGHLVNDYV